MKQILQDRRSGQIEVRDVPAPAPGEGQVLVRTGASLISTGTELAAIRMGKSSLLGKALKRPDLVRKVIHTAQTRGIREAASAVSAKLDEKLPLGYSSSGTVIEIGEGVYDLAPGDRVGCAGLGYASHAEIAAVPINLAVPIPEGVQFEQACYVALGAIALHGIRLSGAGLGDSVLVIGLGLLGILTAQILKAGGTHVIGTDLAKERCHLAATLGADEVLVTGPNTIDRILQATAGRGADAVIITAATKSNDPIRLAGEVARDRACVCVVGDVGLQVPRATYYQKELDLRIARSYGPGRYDPLYEEGGIQYPLGYVPWPERRNMQEFLRLVATGSVRTELLTSAIYPVDEAVAAYKRLESDTDKPIAILFSYPGAATTRRRVDIREKQVSSSGTTVSFIGAGSFARGTLLPRFLQNKVSLRGVATSTGASASSAAERFGFAFSATEADSVLGDPETSAVVIATRHDTHSRLAVDALRAGKHVYLEKPLGLNRVEVETVLEVAQQTDRALMVGYNRRFSALAVQMKEGLGPGPMAIVYRVNAGALPREHWTRDPAVGGGRIVGEACHFVDFVQFLTDSEPLLVSATAMPAADGGTVDTVSFQIRFADGSVASVHYLANGDPALAKEKVEAFAGGRVAVLDDFRRLEIYSGGRRSVTRLRRQDKGHDACVRAFIDICGIGGVPPIPYDCLRASSLITFAVEESIRAGALIRLTTG